MGKDTKIELVYDLIERCDYSELSDLQKQSVLEVMSEDEYLQLRATLEKSQLYFDNESIPDVKSTSFEQGKRPNRFIEFMQKPIPLYRVAAIFVMIATLYFGNIYFDDDRIGAELAQNITNTNSVQTDTIYVTIVDTIEVIKDKIVYVEKKVFAQEPKSVVASASYTLDCLKEICPADIDKLKSLASNNTISNDILLQKFLETLN